MADIAIPYADEAQNLSSISNVQPNKIWARAALDLMVASANEYSDWKKALYLETIPERQGSGDLTIVIWNPLANSLPKQIMDDQTSSFGPETKNAREISMNITQWAVWVVGNETIFLKGRGFAQWYKSTTEDLIRLFMAKNQTLFHQTLLGQSSGGTGPGASIVRTSKADGTEAATNLEVGVDISWQYLKAIESTFNNNVVPSAPKQDGNTEDVPAPVPYFGGSKGPGTYLVIIDSDAKRTLLEDSEFTKSITDCLRNTEFITNSLFDTYWGLSFVERKIPFLVSTGNDDDPVRNCAIVMGGRDAVARLRLGTGNSFVSLNYTFSRRGESLDDPLGLIRMKLGWKAYIGYAMRRPKHVAVLIYKKDGKLT